MHSHSNFRLVSSVGTQPDHELAPTAVILRFHPWISEELLTETQRVWSEAYGREIAADEAIEILVNVRRLAEVLLHAGSKEIAA